MDNNELGQAVVEMLNKQFADSQFKYEGIDGEADEFGGITVLFSIENMQLQTAGEWTCPIGEEPGSSTADDDNLTTEYSYREIEELAADALNVACHEKVEPEFPEYDITIEVVDTSEFNLVDSEADS